MLMERRKSFSSFESKVTLAKRGRSLFQLRILKVEQIGGHKLDFRGPNNGKTEKVLVLKAFSKSFFTN